MSDKKEIYFSDIIGKENILSHLGPDIRSAESQIPCHYRKKPRNEIDMLRELAKLNGK